jgi:hypothetical protein
MRNIAKTFLLGFGFIAFALNIHAQAAFKLKYKNSLLYAGIDIGSKGVKMSVIEAAKNAAKTGAFHILQESSINTDFISFNRPSFTATVNAVAKLYTTALNDYKIAPDRIYTVVSSGIKGQVDKEGKEALLKEFIDSLKQRTRDVSRPVSVIDVLQEARLSHLGIIPEDKRYNTFLIDIGSGNTKGGYFPNGNTDVFKLFEVNWGTKSIANAAEKRVGDDKSISNYNKNVYRVLAGEPNDQIIYAVNASGAYNMSDNMAISGGAAWAAATLAFPELINNQVIPVTYADIVKYSERLLNDYKSLTDSATVIKNLADKTGDKAAIASEIKKVTAVFDQRSLISGTGLLLRIMRQFEGLNEKKQFYLIKNGQVGWISAYIEHSIAIK